MLLVTIAKLHIYFLIIVTEQFKDYFQDICIVNFAEHDANELPALEFSQDKWWQYVYRAGMVYTDLL